MIYHRLPVKDGSDYVDSRYHHEDCDCNQCNPSELDLDQTESAADYYDHKFQSSDADVCFPAVSEQSFKEQEPYTHAEAAARRKEQHEN